MCSFGPSCKKPISWFTRSMFGHNQRADAFSTDAKGTGAQRENPLEEGDLDDGAFPRVT